MTVSHVTRRVFTVLFATALLLCALPLGVWHAAAESDGAYTYTVTDGTATITDYNGTATALTIPSTLGGYSVTTIGEQAFSDCYSLTSIILPDGVTAIGDYAFFPVPLPHKHHPPRQRHHHRKQCIFELHPSEKHHPPRQCHRHRKQGVFPVQRPHKHHPP